MTLSVVYSARPVLLLAVDPGIRGSGVALFRDGSLVSAAYVKNPVELGNQVAACAAMARAVWEWVRGTLGLPAGPLPAVWQWLRATFPTATAWLRALLGADVHQVSWPTVLAFEWPRMYQGSKQSGDQNDLPPLAGVDCAVASLFPDAECVTYYPDEWKSGQVPKKIMNDRVLRALSPEEQACVERGRLEHNTLDAVGVGLKYLGRLERRRGY